MHADHLLLGRPWQFDRRVRHDGFANQYTFKHNGKNVTLMPPSPKQVLEDQQRLKHSMKQLREKEKNKDPKENKEEESKEKNKNYEKNMSGERGKEDKRKTSEKEKEVNLTKEFRLHYITKERRFLLIEKGKNELYFPALQGKQGMTFENFKPSLRYSVGNKHSVKDLVFANYLNRDMLNCSALFQNDRLKIFLPTSPLIRLFDENFFDDDLLNRLACVNYMCLRQIDQVRPITPFIHNGPSKNMDSEESTRSCEKHLKSARINSSKTLCLIGQSNLVHLQLTELYPVRVNSHELNLAR
ncbi:Transposon Ty3-G Gag-Pol polyprotein [Gossypium australe]|uniref:Transposon Ty3-G Gag-Pol polyprotein n=1 Tax=Gossypium australe TaxID=47621 RepID=A0A5B6WHG5_9ROSI|nr:Transposon Ty3-G Gag-Pol polyprotein [Gossypium australe]